MTRIGRMRHSTIDVVPETIVRADESTHARLNIAAGDGKRCSWPGVGVIWFVISASGVGEMCCTASGPGLRISGSISRGITASARRKEWSGGAW